MGVSTDQNIIVAYLNIQGQSGLNIAKEKQIENFLLRNRIDILNLQEINIDENSFKQCSLLSANYYIISNNAINKYGTAILVKKCISTLRHRWKFQRSKRKVLCRDNPPTFS